MKKLFTKIMLYILFPLMIITGFSSWIIIGNKEKTVGVNPGVAVAYIAEVGEGTKYTRIEKALEVANANIDSGKATTQTIYVYPDLKDSAGNSYNIKIDQDCEIKSGVSLILPYEGTTYYTSTFGTLNNFADSSDDYIKEYRKTLVTLSEGVTMTIHTGGSLKIGGIFGNNSSSAQGMTGGTNGKYCEFAMESNARINSSGNIECYGYFKEADKLNNGSMLNLIRGTLKIPFVVYDFKGGTITLGLTNEDICPFDVFDMANVQVRLRSSSAATVMGEARLIVSDIEVAQIITIVGSTTENNAFILNSGYFELKYVPSTFGITQKGEKLGVTTADLYGDLEIGGIYVSKAVIENIYEITIDTATMFFPLSYRFRFNIMSGSTLFCDKQVKFLQGAYLKIWDGATLDISNDVIFYPEDYIEVHAHGGFGYPSFDKGAQFINNGTVNILENGSFAAEIETTVDNAILSVYTDKFTVTSPDDYEQDPRNDCTVTMSGNINGVAETNFSETDSVYVSTTINGVKTWGKFEQDFGLDYYKVFTDEDDVMISSLSGTMTNHSFETTLAINESLTLPAQANQTIDSSIYSFVGWFFNAEATEPLTDSTIFGAQLLRYANANNVATIYAKWTKAPLITIQHYSDTAMTTTYGSAISNIAGTSVTTSSAPADYSVIDGNEKKWYTFKTWEVIFINEDNTTNSIEVAAGQNFDIPKDFKGTSIKVKPIFEYSHSSFKLVVTGNGTGYIDSFTLNQAEDGSNGTTTLPSSTGEYWILDGTTVSITIRSGKGLSKETTTCEISGTISIFDTAKVNSISATGRWDTLASDTFSMPKGIVTLTVSH